MHIIHQTRARRVPGGKHIGDAKAAAIFYFFLENLSTSLFIPISRKQSAISVNMFIMQSSIAFSSVLGFI